MSPMPAFFSKFPIILLNIVWFDFPLAIFSPYYTVSESRTIIAWSNGEKKTQGEKISYIFPQSDFCTHFSATIKIVGEKYDIMSPIACIFSKFPIILWNIVLALTFVNYLFFSLVHSFFFSFFVGARVVFMIFFPHQAIFIPPPPPGVGGYFPIYRPLLKIVSLLLRLEHGFGL